MNYKIRDCIALTLNSSKSNNFHRKALFACVFRVCFIDRKLIFPRYRTLEYHVCCHQELDQRIILRYCSKFKILFLICYINFLANSRINKVEYSWIPKDRFVCYQLIEKSMIIEFRATSTCCVSGVTIMFPNSSLLCRGIVTVDCFSCKYRVMYTRRCVCFCKTVTFRIRVIFCCYYKFISQRTKRRTQRFLTKVNIQSYIQKYTS